MKKLMIAAATAALAAGAFAAEPQVYEMTLTVKSTQCATGKKTVKICDDIEFTSYRKQVTRKYEGLFWGCGCEVIACPTYYFKGLDFDHDTVAPNQETDYIFWSSTKGFQYGLYGDDDAFQWQILQLVGPKAANIEGTWTLVLKNTADEIVLDVAGAGYGTAFDICKDGDTKIKSMSGYVVGSVDYAAEAEVSGCQYCGELTECTPFQFCECIDVQDKTALFGSWSLKYNSSAAKKLAQGKYIESAYKFPKYLNLGNYTEDAGEGETEQTAAQKAEAAYTAAKAELEAATTALNEAKATAKDLENGAAKSEQGKALQKAATDAATATATATTAATTATDTLKTGALAGVLDEEGKEIAKPGEQYVTNAEAIEKAETAVAEAQNKVDKAVGADKIAKANEDLAKAKAELANAQKAQENLEAAITASTDTDANKKAFAKLISDYKDGLKALETAEAAQAEADAALDTWTNGDEKTEGSFKKAQADADDAIDAAQEAYADAKAKVTATQAACIAVGGDCK